MYQVPSTLLLMFHDALSHRVLRNRVLCTRESSVYQNKAHAGLGSREEVVWNVKDIPAPQEDM